VLDATDVLPGVLLPEGGFTGPTTGVFSLPRRVLTSILGLAFTCNTASIIVRIGATFNKQLHAGIAKALASTSTKATGYAAARVKGIVSSLVHLMVALGAVLTPGVVVGLLFMNASHPLLAPLFSAPSVARVIFAGGAAWGLWASLGSVQGLGVSLLLAVAGTGLAIVTNSGTVVWVALTTSLPVLTLAAWTYDDWSEGRQAAAGGGLHAGMPQRPLSLLFWRALHASTAGAAGYLRGEFLQIQNAAHLLLVPPLLLLFIWWMWG
jgi:hypothetical protein